MDRTPRRSSAVGTYAQTPHTPAELNIVSKVGIQATVEDGFAKGLICVKLAIPRDSAGTSWALFNGPTPQLRSIPALYPLPVTPFLLGRGPSNLLTAVALLNLEQKAAYPPSTTDAGVHPRLETSPNGQVTVIAEESPRRASGRSGPATPSRRESGVGLRDRAEFLAIIEFQLPVDVMTQGIEEHFSVALPVPKCLDNVIRLRLDHGPDRDVSITAEPKILPTPLRRDAGANLFQAASPTRKRQLEDGWEDGEVPGAESEESEEEDEDGSVLEGRFPAADKLSLSWQFMASLDSPPDLRVAPKWDAKSPSIALLFEAGVPAADGTLSLEAVLPSGWGWQELEIRGDGLLSWRSTDEDLASEAVEPAGANDSMATELAPSPSLRPATRVVSLDASRLELLNADDLAPLDDADFSFNDTSLTTTTTATGRKLPTTPSRRRKAKDEKSPSALLSRNTHMHAVYRVSPRVPVPAGLFELEFEPPQEPHSQTRFADSDTEDDDEDRRPVVVEGILVPLPQVLVSPDIPISIPFMRFDNARLPDQCTVTCANATFSDGDDKDQDRAPRLCSTAATSVGKFTWTDDAGNVVPRRPTLPILGPVRVVVQRNIWGVQTVLAALTWPPRAAELAVTFSAPSVRVVKAVAGVAPLAYAVLPIDGGAGAEVRVAGGRGPLDLVLEVADDTGVALPRLTAASGELKVELAGDGWDKLLAIEPKTNLTRVTDRGFLGDLTSTAPPLITFRAAPPPPKPAGTLRRFFSWLFSWAGLLAIVLLWVLLSLLVQVQRLRTEVAFVAEEARDLRLYALERERAEREARERERERGYGYKWDSLWDSPSPPAKSESVTQVPVPTPEPVKEQDPELERERERERQRERDHEREREQAREEQARREFNSHPRSQAVAATGEYGLGRVVLGSAWPAWTENVVRNIVSTMEDLWRGVAWLWSQVPTGW